MRKYLTIRDVLAGLCLASAISFAGCDHPPPMPDMTGVPDLATGEDLRTNVPDLACNPADPGCVPPPDMRTTPPDMIMTPPDMRMTPPDLFMPPPDLFMPPPDLFMPPADMITPPADMIMPPADMIMPPVDMTMPPVDMTMPPIDMTMPADMRPPVDMTMPPADMRPPVDMTMPPADMTTPPTDGGMVTGGIGAACTDDTGCRQGTMPKCWKTNVLNNTTNPPTPGGYCSSECTTDTQCGTGNRCVQLTTTTKYCVAGCSNATTCRHPGYACAYFGSGGICFPDAIFDCDPKSGTGACTEAGSGKAGGCIRQAYENKGNCSASCTVGKGTCAAAGGTPRQCVYFDTSKTTDMDAWKGMICLESVPTPVTSGGACMYVNECEDGYQCDGASGTCQQLCVKGGTPACTTGTCADGFMTPATGPGICR